MTTTEFEIVHGDTRTYEIRITKEDGDPQELEDGELVVTAKLRMADEEPLFTKTEGSGIDYDDDETGLALLQITPADLEGVPNAWTTLVFDVRFLVDGAAQTPIRGVIRVRPSVGEVPES